MFIDINVNLLAVCRWNLCSDTWKGKYCLCNRGGRQGSKSGSVHKQIKKVTGTCPLKKWN